MNIYDVMDNPFDLLVNENIQIMKEHNVKEIDTLNINVIRKETLHFDIFDIFKDLKIFHSLVFVGGTSLRRIYNSPRLSEDLDFQTDYDFDLSLLDNVDIKIPEYLKDKYNLNSYVIKKMDRTTNTKALNIDLIVSKKNKVPHRKIHIDFELCPAINPVLSNVNPIYPSEYKNKPNGFDILSITKDEILANKLIAITERNYIKGRDFYDCIFLLKSGTKINEYYINKRIKNKRKYKDFNVNQFKENLISKINEFNIKSVKMSVLNELSNFITKSELKNFESKYNTYTSFFKKIVLGNEKDREDHSLQR